MKYLNRYNEGIVQKFKDYFNPPVKKQSMLSIRKEILDMVRDLDLLNIDKDLSDRSSGFKINYKDSLKSFMDKYGNQMTSLVKDDDGYYKIDISKFLKDPSPWVFDKNHKNRILTYFKEYYDARKERDEEVSKEMGWDMGKFPTPFLKNPIVNMDNLFKKINENRSFKYRL